MGTPEGSPIIHARARRSYYSSYYDSPEDYGGRGYYRSFPPPPPPTFPEYDYQYDDYEDYYRSGRCGFYDGKYHASFGRRR